MYVLCIVSNLLNLMIKILFISVYEVYYYNKER